ncbi:adenylosuccinate synthetase [Paenibacillus baekrokdamisoli]|uniref:Adenylosuccinate synthetase n=1 Tax=Paenibacillus baekrokdamisoli TaxID=1712516 RepID=A0A3G9J5S8_9BACL|nr:adenylosuccinate synthase [Paenibacillus baekrokdamisoli]MBB3069336.1 adenylosuccinate synthase [Paenibacillus baekrokdamisoli]BBH18694.1 adenylosuccinate synthetase [Paenibacillus baekrokdamisoli]
MPITAIVGANWGDEGKGKITDALAGNARYVVRYQGGSNAGHTIINAYGKFALHLLPSGVFYPETTNIIGTGVALNLSDLFQELDGLKTRGVPEPNLRISDRAQLVLPYHKLFDELEEERLGDGKFGSTRSGIAPFYADKAAKLGIQVADLYEEERLRTRLKASLAAKNVLLEHLYKKPLLDLEDLIVGLQVYAERLRPFVCNTSQLLRDAVNKKEQILVEGQLGALRDPDHGIYPYSTSSSTLAGYASVGAGVPPHAIQRIIAVTKAYSSSVGEGPFVTELEGADAEKLRKLGGDAGEYGATTGRPRRMGWFDAVATAYGCSLQGATEVALTNLDVLGYLEAIPICTAYEIDGKQITLFPVTPQLVNAKPILETMPGWMEDISSIREFTALPPNAQQYVRYLEQLIGIPIRWISVGPRREQLIERV